MWLVEKPETVQIHFTIDYEDVTDRIDSIERKLYIVFYMAVSGECFHSQLDVVLNP